MSECVVCEGELTGRQRQFCSEACKQRAKYEQSKGERCRVCKLSMKPVAVLGGYRQAHKRCEKGDTQ